MPIKRTLELRSISNDEFSRIDAAVIKFAYATQNHFGRLFDERVYENHLASLLRAAGFSVQTQVPVRLTHANFEKTYILDLVVDEMLYELKVVNEMTTAHEVQALNYAMLQNIPLVKLINFGGDKVTGQLLRNALTPECRYQLAVDDSNWRPLGPQCRNLVGLVKSLLHDWGTNLDFRAYNEALIHHFGGVGVCLRRTVLQSDGLCLGTHLVQHHDSHFAFVVTGFTHSQVNHRRHLNVLLQHATDINGIQWINFNQSTLELATVARE